MNFKERIRRTAKSRGARVALAAAITATAVLGGTQTAMAGSGGPDATVNVGSVQSPNGYGHWTGKIIWINDSGNDGIAQLPGKLWDDADDGHGPYMHVFTSYTPNTISYHDPNCDYHNTNGYNTYINTTYCQPTDGRGLYAVDIWMCNGGDSNGNGTTTSPGCYGRRAYNQVKYPGKPSMSLGFADKPVGVAEA